MEEAKELNKSQNSDFNFILTSLPSSKRKRLRDDYLTARIRRKMLPNTEAAFLSERVSSSSSSSSSVSLFSSLLLTSTIIVLFIIQPANGFSGLAVGLSGNHQKCDIEGELFLLPGSIRNPCFSCQCRNKRVECEKKACPTSNGCFLIVPGQKEGCCEVCKECTWGNKTLSSDTEIVDKCQVTKCIAGIITRSKVQCPTLHCKNPLPTKGDECCPVCPGCTLHGAEYNEGQEATFPGDQCVRCKCQNGNMKCEKKSCPVLACPASATYLEKGECCPKCNGSRTRYMPRNVCLLGKKVYPSGESFKLDTCTNCTCINTTTICDRVSCPPLECDSINQVMTQGSCCPVCSKQTDEYEIKGHRCLWADTLYNNGDTWKIDSCRSCQCDFGEVRCSTKICQKDNLLNCPPSLIYHEIGDCCRKCNTTRPKQLSLPITPSPPKLVDKCSNISCPRISACPYGQKLKYDQNHCCPRCAYEDNGICTIFGDPHYRTFDGRVFNFQGTCKYLLSADCKEKTFSIRVRNDVRESTSFSWTRTVTLKVKEGRVTLGQRMRIKFNGKRVALPFYHGTLRIVQDEYNAIVETGVGVKLLWNGDSYLEVSVPYNMRGNLCGLCGNFNGNKTDDFITRKSGYLVTTPNEFGSSWRVGGKKACSRSPEEVKGPDPICKQSWRLRIKAEKQCSAIKSDVFAKCHKVVPFNRYFKSCLIDQCECGGRNCYCEAALAYARECQRHGINIDWRERTGCEAKKRWRTRFLNRYHRRQKMSNRRNSVSLID